MYIIKLLSGAYLIEGSLSWSPTLLQYEATRYESERKAAMAGQKLLGRRSFSTICV